MIAGVLLTGGSSRRMGRDKATMVVRGEQLATRTARILGTVCDPVVEVGRGVSELKCVREYPPGSGPLAALVAGADELGVDEVLLLACDYPFIDEPVLRLVTDWRAGRTVIPVAAGRLQFACARYGPESLAAARIGLQTGRVSLSTAAEVDHDLLLEDVWAAAGPANTFADIDTPNDVRDLGLT